MHGEIIAGDKRTTVAFDPPDMSRIEAALSGRRRGAREAFQSFREAWEARWKDALHMSAWLSVCGCEPAENDWLPLVPGGVRDLWGAHSSASCVAAIWTAGDEVDRISQTLANENIAHGFFLEMAATLGLMAFHGAIADYLQKNFAECGEQNCSGEYYPGCEGGELSAGGLVGRIAERAVRAGLPVRLTAHGMFYPRKTQCSLAFFGLDGRIPKLPCEACAGKRCMYYQLGGCHMGAGWIEK